MKIPPQRKLGFAVIILAVMVSASVLLFTARQPSYGGKSISQWFRDINATQGENSALEAFRRTIPESVQFLFQELSRKKKESPAMRAYREVYQRLPAILRDRIPPLLSAAERRRKACWILGRLGEHSTSAVPALIEALRDSDDEVRAKAARALGEIGPKAAESVGALSKMIERHLDPSSSRDHSVTREAMWALGALGAAANSATPVLVKVVQTKDNSPEAKADRASAANALGRIGPSARLAVPALTGALEESDEWIRLYAAQSLGMIGQESASAVPHLVERLSDASSHVRWASARALTLIRVHDPAAVSILRKLLKNDDKMVRLYAATALTAFKNRDDDATEVIERALDADEDGMLQGHALYILGRLGSTAAWAIPKIEEILADSRSAEVCSAAKATLVLLGQESNQIAGDEPPLSVSVLTPLICDHHRTHLERVSSGGRSAFSLPALRRVRTI